MRLEVSRSLAKLICGNLGIVPGINHKNGLFSDVLRSKLRVSLEDDEGKVISYPVYSGRLKDISCLAVNVGDENDPEIALVLGNANTVTGLQFEWSDTQDSGLFLVFVSDGQSLPSPVLLSMLQKLRLACLFEEAAQQGMQWDAADPDPELFKKLIRLLSSSVVDSEKKVE